MLIQACTNEDYGIHEVQTLAQMKTPRSIKLWLLHKWRLQGPWSSGSCTNEDSESMKSKLLYKWRLQSLWSPSSCTNEDLRIHEVQTLVQMKTLESMKSKLLQLVTRFFRMQWRTFKCDLRHLPVPVVVFGMKNDFDCYKWRLQEGFFQKKKWSDMSATTYFLREAVVVMILW
jgi:hypothetical protein